MQACGLKLTRNGHQPEIGRSRLMQACGLKLKFLVYRPLRLDVTPYAGVWIETSSCMLTPRIPPGHALCRRVD